MASTSGGPSHKRARTEEPATATPSKIATPLNRMHPGNCYAHYTPDFAALAKQYPDTLGPFVRYLDAEQTEAVIDWEDPQAARALTATLLQHDFGLAWDIPAERLCPPVPNRLNYVCWIRDLLLLGHPQLDDSAVRGLDIGTGASAIYPLLGARVYGWSFLGTDIDEAALQAAHANVTRNALDGRIALKLVPRADYSGVSLDQPDSAAATPGPMLAALDGGTITTDPTTTTPGGQRLLDFAMCNPPFFASLDEIGSAHGPHGKGAGMAPHACADELLTPGGELSFVTAMVRDSLRLQEKVGWYSSMVGKKGTLRRVLALLRGAGVRNVRTTEFLQGRTTRWGVAWSFTGDGLAELEGGAASAHRVFGRRRQAQKREAVEHFAVKPSMAGEALDEEAVLARVLEYLQETRQVNVLRVGCRASGAEEFYRRVILAEISSEGQPCPQGPGPVLEERAEVTAAFAPVSPQDPRWKRRCLLLVAAVAGGSSGQEEGEGEEGDGKMEVEGEGEGQQAIKVTVEMTSGGDRAAFWKVCGLMPGEVGRTNRRWRRKLGGGGGGKKGAAGEE